MLLSRKIIFLIAFSLMSLSSMTQTNSRDNTNFFNPENFLGDTLFIKSRFMECGEWGGHLELLKVYLKKNEFHITYKKFSADCNTIKDNNGEPRQTLVKSLNKILLDKDKQLVRQYFHELLEAKFREPTPMHAAYVFEIKNADKSIYLFVYTWGSKTKDEYVRFIKQLFE
jgi:hypothetical protein